ATRAAVLGGDDRHDPPEPEPAKDDVATGQRGLRRVAAAPRAPDDVIADLRHELAIDRLEHWAAVTEERAVGSPHDRPEPEAIPRVAVASPADPGLGLCARLRGGIMLHGDRVAENLEHRLDVVEGQFADDQAIRAGDDPVGKRRRLQIAHGSPPLAKAAALGSAVPEADEDE